MILTNMAEDSSINSLEDTNNNDDMISFDEEKSTTSVPLIIIIPDEERENGDGDSGSDSTQSELFLDIEKSSEKYIEKDYVSTSGGDNNNKNVNFGMDNTVDVADNVGIDIGEQELNIKDLTSNQSRIGVDCGDIAGPTLPPLSLQTDRELGHRCEDIQDIVRDFQAVETLSNGLLETMSDDEVDSLSPRAPLAVEIPILEAPEPFRSTGRHVDSNEPEEASQRNHDNTVKAETGDTFGRTLDKDKSNVYENFEKCLTNDNNVEWHVGSASPPHQSPNLQSSQTVTLNVDSDCDVTMLVDDIVVKTEEDDCGNEVEGHLNVNSFEYESESGPCLCADEPESKPSIEIGVAECAQASGCSRVSTAEVCAALNPDPTDSCIFNTPNNNNNNQNSSIIINYKLNDINNDVCNSENKTFPTLSWSFKNGRLVFVESENSRTTDTTTEQVVENDQSDNDDSIITILHSKDLNKKIDENRSRLKYLEQKLKEAGITDDDTNIVKKQQQQQQQQEQVVDKSKHCYVDDNQNILKDIIPEESSTSAPLPPQLFSEFDVRKVDAFSEFNTNYIQVYDELNNETNHINMRDNNSGTSMGVDGERTKHNPDRENLKSLLKRPGRQKDNSKRNNRVVFNENKNEFFDADYIILIREECDYDEEDDDGVCTCNQHEMVRLTCCEPNCNCNVYDGYDQTPQSPKFAPPLEFVDAVTLSPPEGYKDMELGEQQLLALQQMARRSQRTAVCRECSVTHEDEDDDGDGSQSDNEACCDVNSDHDEQEEKEKTDQSQQTTPTTPPNDSENSNSQRYILETITMTTVKEQRILREADEEKKTPPTVIPSGGSPINGILKGGRLWKQQSLDVNTTKPPEPQQNIDSSITSDEETNNRRSVRFIESEQDKRDVCDGASDNPPEEDEKQEKSTNNSSNEQQMKSSIVSNSNSGGENNETTTTTNTSCNNSVSPESTEMMLTFKLGNHVLISNNSLKPNSAVRQLFPCTKPIGVKGEDESIHQYLVTAESLRAFEEAKRSKLPQIIQSGETDESIKRAIERNTLRRSLIRYEPKSRKNVQKTDNSLVERIKQLTCDVDDTPPQQESEDIPPRASPPGEEARNSPEVTNHTNKNHDKSFSPSSSSTASSNSSSMSSTYKKITDLFGKREKATETQTNPTNDNCNKLNPSLPDLGNGGNHIHEIGDNHCKINATNESRKQFLSTLAPLTACVSGIAAGDEYFYHMANHIGERASVASSVGTEYSLEDIDEGLKNAEEESKKIAPDVLAGTPSASESGDELAMFVQQDAGRIERIKKKYQAEQSNKDEDDEHDDYGFNRRPSVRGIKPRFGSTTEILQQIQNQLQPPPPTQTARVNWPYYSESGLTGVDNAKSRNINQNMPNYQYPPNVPEDLKTRNMPPQYRPTTLQDENLYQNCANQRCMREVYRTNVNQTYSTIMKVGGSCTDYYQSLPRMRNGRPQSPPPLEMSKTYHQTMVYIPYNHLEGYQPTPYYQNDYVRVTNQNQINKRYIDPIYQQRIHPHVDEHHYGSTTMLPPMASKPMIRPPYSQHVVSSRSESPLPGQFSTARSTQTPAPTPSTCNYYSTNPRYRPMIGPVWQNDPTYVTKMNRHSFPTGNPRYPSDNISLTDSDSQHSNQLPNGYRQPVDVTYSTPKDSIPNSPTKPRFIERGVPEGAASVTQQDSTSSITSQNSSSSTMTSPTSPQNPTGPTAQPNQKPLFYAMNV